MNDDRKAWGTACEALAAAHLERRGWRIRERNFRTRLGEVDLVCEDGMTIVFVEVKARRGSRFGTGAEAVDARKQAKLTAIAGLYMQRHPGRACRFDVISITQRGPDTALEHFVSAFP